MPKTLVAESNEFISELAEPSIEMPEVDIDADETAPDATLVPDVSAVDDVRVVEDVAVDVRASSALGVAAEVSGDTVCTPVPADVPAACVTVVASPDKPAGLVVCSGAVNGVNAEAADDAPA